MQINVYNTNKEKLFEQHLKNNEVLIILNTSEFSVNGIKYNIIYSCMAIKEFSFISDYSPTLELIVAY